MDSCAADQACSQAYPNLQDVLFDVIERLNAEPITIIATRPYSGQTYDAILTGDGVFGNLVALLYQTQIIPILPQAIYDVYNGDYKLMTQLRSINLLFIEALSRGMEFSVVCTDDLIGKTPQDLLNVRAQLPRELAGAIDPEDVIEYGVFAVCENWPVEQAEAWVKQPVLSDIPTLVLEGEFDPVTPPEHGRLVAGHLSNGYYFEFHGIGHDITVASECARKIAGGFVDNPKQSPDASCNDEMPGVVFDVPGEVVELVWESFSDEARGFSLLLPVGWEELAPANMMRGNTALDPTYFVLEATPGTADELYSALAPQLGLDDDLEPVAETEVGSFTWTVYTFELRGDTVDLALAEDELKAYFVILISTPEEHDVLYEQLFMPALEAMRSLN